jgi:hypothetical protein
MAVNPEHDALTLRDRQSTAQIVKFACQLASAAAAPRSYFFFFRAFNLEADAFFSAARIPLCFARCFRTVGSESISRRI